MISSSLFLFMWQFDAELHQVSPRAHHVGRAVRPGHVIVVTHTHHHGGCEHHRGYLTRLHPVLHHHTVVRAG